MKYNISDYVKQIMQVLASDKKRIGFLFGAGSSCAYENKEDIHFPAVAEMTKNIISKITEEKYKKAINDIINELVDSCTIEDILSNIEEKNHVIGSGTLNGLNKTEMNELSLKIKQLIIEQVSLPSEITEEQILRLPHYKFSQWIGRTERKYPIEIYTTNYDYLFELALEHNDIPYYDGFTGSLKPFFNSLSTEDIDFLQNEVKLWKIHGSLGWKNENNKIIRDKTDNKDIIIYPSLLKYDNSKKMPYVALIDRLCKFISQDDSVLFVSGYSFGDEHINERLITSLKRSGTTHIYVFLFDEYKDSDGNDKYLLQEENNKYLKISSQTSKISFIGFKNGIIDGRLYEWSIEANKNLDLKDIGKYFELNSDNTFKKVLLPNFVQLAKFIFEMSVNTSKE